MSDIIESVPPEPTPSPRGFRLPADYYAAPASEVRPIFPRWVPLGCGSAAAAFLVLAFIGGAVVGEVGVGSLMEMLLGSMADEIRPMVGKDVSLAQRTELENEMSRLRANVREERLTLTRLDPVVSAIREATADHAITPAEAAKLTATMRALNREAAAPKRPAAKKSR